jgi:hypothetical protein
MTNRIGLAALFLFCGMLAPALATPSAAQSVQPLIMEYKGSADGKIMLTNNTSKPLVVVLEPRSFNISLDGVGTFRHLDPSIKVELSRTSVRLEPKQSYYVFYKASSLTLPAWFTIYSAFSQAQHGEGMDVRILLPHTVYLYQKEPIPQSDVQVVGAVFSPKTRKLVCYLQNDGNGLARVQEVLANGTHTSQNAAGFPLLPAATRKIELDWQEKNPPSEVSFRFEHFTVKHPVAWESPTATP